MIQSCDLCTHGSNDPYIPFALIPWYDLAADHCCSHSWLIGSRLPTPVVGVVLNLAGNAQLGISIGNHMNSSAIWEIIA